jgi:hypothetical protein
MRHDRGIMVTVTGAMEISIKVTHDGKRILSKEAKAEGSNGH